MATNRIHAKGDARLEEINAGATGIYPGHLLKLNSSGAVINHDTAGGRAEKMFAEEDALEGSTLATVYVNGRPVRVLFPVSGSEVYAMLRDGQDIAIGDELVSNGDGTLKKAADMNSYDELQEVIGIALEALDLSGSSGTNSLIRIRVK